jgi:C4-type Zn-finger protein
MKKAKYLQRSCPRCDGYVGIVLRDAGHNTQLQAVNGHCLGCGYRLAWIVIRGKRMETRRIEPKRSHRNSFF